MAGELGRPHIAHASLRWAVTGASLAQIVGLLLFFHTMWPRIRAAGSQLREQKGERF